VRNILFIVLLITVVLSERPQTFRDNLGDFLIAPAYISSNGVKTKIKLANTNPKASFLVRAVIYDRVHQKEVNFLIMLAPSDIWRATIDNGIITSKSNSNFNKRALLDGVDLDSVNSKFKEIDFSVGYMEFYPFVQFDTNVTKKNIRDRYHKIVKDDNEFVRDSGADSSSLVGFVTLQSSDNREATLPMMAYKGAISSSITGDDATPKSITNPSFYIDEDNVDEIYKDMQSREILVPFNNKAKGVKLIMTFWNDKRDKQNRKFLVSTFKGAKSIIDNEEKHITDSVEIINIESLIKKSHSNHNSGIVQIKNITNLDDGQFEGDEKASVIPTILQTSKHNGKISIDSWVYAPSIGY